MGNIILAGRNLAGSETSQGLGRTDPGKQTGACHAITIDDMNDWTTLFDKGNPIKTPSMERLVARGWLFERAYCTSPGCAPSRVSIMTGTAVE